MDGGGWGWGVEGWSVIQGTPRSSMLHCTACGMHPLCSHFKTHIRRPISPKQNRKSGIPTVVAVDKTGHLLEHMDVGMEGLELLDKKWRYKEWRW